MAVQQDSLVGRKIGRYHLASLLGRGRGAVVYSATDSVIGRTVAIKILDRQHAADPDVTAQFLRDAAILSQLRHPNILPIYEFDQYDDRAYIVRQHTAGGTLRTYLREAGVLGVPDALALLRPVATGLDYAHRQGFVHGNLRPSNIVRTAAGALLLTDFAVPGQGNRPPAPRRRSSAPSLRPSMPRRNRRGSKRAYRVSISTCSA